MAPVDILQTFQMALDTQFAGGEWWTANAIALMISVALVAIGWMIASVMRSSELKAWANEEFSQFLFTAVIIGTLIILIPLVNIISISLFDDNYFKSGEKYFVELTGEMEQSLSRLTVLRMTYSVAKTVRIPIPPLAVAYGSPLKAPIGPFGTLQKMIYPALMSSLVQLELLEFMKATMFTFILPIGIALRAFPLTRRAGSTLIAIAITGYVIYPLSVNYGFVMYQSAKQSFGLVEVPLIDLSGGDLINREIPGYETVYVTKSDYIRWTVLTPEFAYRIWKDRDCNSVPKIDWASVKQPPYDSSINFWDFETKIGTSTGRGDTSFDVDISGSGGETISGVPILSPGCYSVIERGEGKFGEPIIYQLRDPRVLDNQSLSILLDVYNKNENGTYSAIDYDRTDLYVGDPCEKGLFNSIMCYVGYDFKGEKLGAAGTGAAIGSGFLTAMGDIVANSGWIRALENEPGFWAGKAAFTPFLSAFVFLDFTETLPKSIFPAFMSVFTLVFSLIVSIASFRGISQMMRGESSIEELGRLV